METVKVRKQVYELSGSDLQKWAVWEFALDEEGEPDQDEATVRPFNGIPPVDPADGMFVVRARFTLADGTQFSGYLTPPVQGEAGFDTIQPVIVTRQGHVLFWYGTIAPNAEAIRQAYGTLGRQAAAVFPVRFVSDVDLVGGPVKGTLSGFMHYRSFSDQTVLEVT